MAENEQGLVIAAVCRALAEGASARAETIVQRDYPFAPAPVTARRFRPTAYTKAFIRDGFIDRYSGARLVFPPVVTVHTSASSEGAGSWAK